MFSSLIVFNQAVELIAHVFLIFHFVHKMIKQKSFEEKDVIRVTAQSNGKHKKNQMCHLSISTWT